MSQNFFNFIIQFGGMGRSEPEGVHLKTGRCGGKIKTSPLSGSRPSPMSEIFSYENSDLARGLRKREPRATKGGCLDFSRPRSTFLNEHPPALTWSSLPYIFKKRLSNFQGKSDSFWGYECFISVESLPRCWSITMVSPSRTWSSRMARATRVSTFFWMKRRRGRAPNWGS